ncbi:hypothetical protein [Clostridium sp. CCUG 7971]|nr:hypothetical protein [Clostridium sp. CCUG 7971]MBO3445280.1 hypothetical protein [Clostridium sp. CCUG 7971]
MSKNKIKNIFPKISESFHNTLKETLNNLEEKENVIKKQLPNKDYKS